jgi:glycine/D-amino acid oxidase-like deaminating enzyme
LVTIVVLGAGFYGCKIAIELKALGVDKVILVDPNPVGSQATTANQNRIHGGYHYPRSIVTAASARKNYLRFLADHAKTIKGNKRHVYAIGNGSFTSPEEFERVCDAIGAPLRPILESLFSNRIQAAYEVDEVAFDIDEMKHLLIAQLEQARVERMHAHGFIREADDKGVDVEVQFKDGLRGIIRADYVFNCTYGSLDQVGTPIITPLKKEWTEVAIIDPPLELWETDITVMDGPFWSLMSYPSRSMHALTHVKYTPHYEWFPQAFPHESGREGSRYGTKWLSMRDDAARYVPLMQYARYVDSLYTTRVVLAQNEPDDGRPVLWEYSPLSPRIISVLGSKFNSIYDALDKLREGEWRRDQHTRSVRTEGRRALVGRGFVGSNLMTTGRFTDYYNSTNVEEMRGHYAQVVIAAPSAAKWWVNEHPDDDMDSILQMQKVLSRLTADDVVLISTVDARSLEPYGLHRRILENFVRAQFENARIVRLPALYGPGLKKNALYDMLNNPERGSDDFNRRGYYVHPDDQYQFYNIIHLWNDLKSVVPGTLVEFLPAPVTLGWVAEQLGLTLPLARIMPVKYDYRVPSGGYTESVEQVKEGLSAFIKEYKK